MKNNKFSIRNKPSLYKERMAIQKWLKLDPRHRKELLARQSILSQPSQEQEADLSLGEASALLEESFSSLETDLGTVETSPSLKVSSPKFSFRDEMKKQLSKDNRDSTGDLSLSSQFETLLMDESSEISPELMAEFVAEIKNLTNASEGQTFFLDLGDQLLFPDKDVVPPELQTENPIVMPKNLEARKMEEKINEKRKDKKVTVVNPASSRLKN